jgi:hypothetical protein
VVLERREELEDPLGGGGYETGCIDAVHVEIVSARSALVLTGTAQK